MQLCALDRNDELIFAAKALKQTDYQCLECRETVRVRSGLHRRAHFYHVRPNGQCRMHSKGMPHLMLQYHLVDILPEGEVEMECRFPSIGRIADIAWHAKKIVYEIQYSPISADEVLARNAAYASAGYRTVWILHEWRYNQPLISAAEDVLAGSPHYYTNMNEKGDGYVYDQFACVERNIRRYRLPKLPIDLASPYDVIKNDLQVLKLPRKMIKRTDSWSLGFSGDTLDRLKQFQGVPSDKLDHDLVKRVAVLRDEDGFGALRFNIEFCKTLVKQWLVRPYKILLKHMLEKACR